MLNELNTSLVKACSYGGTSLLMSFLYVPQQILDVTIWLPIHISNYKETIQGVKYDDNKVEYPVSLKSVKFNDEDVIEQK